MLHSPEFPCNFDFPAPLTALLDFAVPPPPRRARTGRIEAYAPAPFAPASRPLTPPSVPDRCCSNPSIRPGRLTEAPRDKACPACRHPEGLGFTFHSSIRIDNRLASGPSVGGHRPVR